MSKINLSTFNSSILVFFPYPRWCYGGFFICWPEGMSYLAWEKLLKRCLQSFKKNKRVQKSTFEKKKGLLKSDKTEAAMQSLVEILEKQGNKEESKETPQGASELKVFKEEKISLELITLLKKFLERKKISQCIENEIHDSRDQKMITYSKQSIILAALSIFLFRLGSGNQYEEASHNVKGKYSKTNIAKFIETSEVEVPIIKTIEDFLKTQDENSMNRLMISFFKELIESKFFESHSEIMPGDFFLLAADCIHTHTYDHPHHTDENGDHDCPYCLKRVYNKGTEKEKERWIHNTLVYCLVFFGHLKIPIYHYPIHAKQMIDYESASDSTHKQECELVALKSTLPIIKKIFLKRNVVMLLDGLYANRPTIRLINSFEFGYIIVRKQGNIPTLAKDCEGLSKLPNHKKNHTKTSEQTIENWRINHTYEWFNSMDIGDKEEELITNVLRFKETREKKIKNKLKRQEYYCEWLFSWKLSAKNCALFSCLARLRWEEEDLFNSLKNRGFKFKHDYSRDPRSFFNWHGLSLFAFGIFELFRFSEVVQKKADVSRIRLADVVQAQLYERRTEEIFFDQLTSKKIQFRYHFNTEQKFYDKSEWHEAEWRATG